MPKPNVIVVLTDQLRSFEVGCYGNQTIQTPNIDQLAANGVRFDLGISNNPVCTPARCCLLTGEYGRTCTGEVTNVSADPPCQTRRRLPHPTLAEELQQAGYHTALIGKWHIDPSPLLLGLEQAYYPLTIHRYLGQTFFDNDEAGPPIEDFAPEHEIERVGEYVKEHRDEPFFLFYNISLPHMPIGPRDLPPRYTEMYDPTQLPLRPNVFIDGKMAHDERWFKIYTIWDLFWRLANRPCWEAAPECGYPGQIGPLPTDTLPDGFDLRHLTALYYGAVTCADDMLGRLMAILRDNGLDDDTIVVFTSDHGDNLGSRHRFNKDCLFEESIRIPMIFHWPAKLAALGNDQQIAQLIDIMPTLLELCGLETPGSVQGQSLAPVLRGEQTVLPDNFAFVETPGGRPTIGLRTPTHIYGMEMPEDWREPARRQSTDGHWGFYDLVADPLQERDLLATGEQASLAAELEAQLTAWHRRTPWHEVE